MTSIEKTLAIIVRYLRPYSKKLQVAGSIRRRQPHPHDIDIVLIPRDWNKIKQIFQKKTKPRILGDDIVSGWYKGVQIDVFRAEPSYWGAMLMHATGPQGASIGLRIIARKKGMKLNQYGLWKGKKRIAGRTERSIYRALGKKYKEPYLR